MSAGAPIHLGVVYALLAYGAWGISPLFWRELRHVDPSLVLAHRVIWGGLVFFALLAYRRRVGELARSLEPRTLAIFTAAAGLLAANWFLYLYAINSEQVVQASLGYFINPLLNVVLGMAFLRERLGWAQWLAVGLAATGVILLSTRTETFPWIALLLAASFGTYGLVRKTTAADALLGSNLEMVALLPVALGYFALQPAAREHVVTADGWTLALLLFTGLQTALPLLWFANAARRLPYSTLGFFQYLAPTCQFLLAVLVFHEPFSRLQLNAFVLIWAGLAVLTAERPVRRLIGRRGPVPAS